MMCLSSMSAVKFKQDIHIKLAIQNLIRNDYSMHDSKLNHSSAAVPTSFH